MSARGSLRRTNISPARYQKRDQEYCDRAPNGCASWGKGRDGGQAVELYKVGYGNNSQCTNFHCMRAATYILFPGISSTHTHRVLERATKDTTGVAEIGMALHLEW